jgi:hypothetical protein
MLIDLQVLGFGCKHRRGCCHAAATTHLSPTEERIRHTSGRERQPEQDDAVEQRRRQRSGGRDARQLQGPDQPRLDEAEAAGR